MSVLEKLRSLGLELPAVAAPVGSYLPAIRCGSFVFTSGQLPMRDGKLMCAGKVGRDVSLDQAVAGARQAGLNALAAASSVVSGIDQIGGIVRVAVFVAGADGFTDQPKVANGASDLFVALFGESGRHARAAVGVAELPLNATVEIELVARCRD